MQASGSSERTAMADGSWLAWSVGGLAGIWTAVVLISVLAPDLVSGSEQDHLPIAAFTTWLWGLVATGGFLWAMARLRGSASRRPIWVGPAVATLTVWLVATILSLALPVVETGSDPTRIPIAAVVTPVAATVLTFWPASSQECSPDRLGPVEVGDQYLPGAQRGTMRLGRSSADDAGMTSTGIQVGTLTPAADNVHASQPRHRGRVRVPGFGPAERRFQVRHLMIFRVPIVGVTRPAAVGAA
jgi:hypothetical protein